VSRKFRITVFAKDMEFHLVVFLKGQAFLIQYKGKQAVSLKTFQSP
jgi:hypothetical protein